MERGKLIAVNEGIYEYDRYDKYLKIHIATEVMIDEDGYLTATHIPHCFTDEELTDREEPTFTKNQWYGIVAHFIREGNFDLNEEEMEDATEDIVGRCFAYGIPKFEELSEYIADYMNR